MRHKTKNILFIMFDQLRFDYLSCAGHPYLQTPHIDALAQKGVRFTRAYTQSPICGPSRMSFYTGRYTQSHGAQYNNFPLRVGEATLGDHLRQAGMDCYLIGKTHMRADTEGMARLGITTDSIEGSRVAECGFDVVVREDGLRPMGIEGAYDPKASPYNQYLASRGYSATNPWHENANAAVLDEDIASGWLLKNAHLPANIREQDSETPWLTGEAIKFLNARQDSATPWLCHLSYIKPHWPYIVPLPYADMYAAEHVIPANKHPQEREAPHPIYAAYLQKQVSKSFAKEEVRQKVIPAYMGLIKQCDDQMGCLFKYLEESGRMDDTMIVITSDHGDYLGDHWLGEKDLFHDCSVKIPLIVYDPSPEADATRGTCCDELVEAIDLAATFVASAGMEPPRHILEGHSLLPFLYDQPPETWREFAVSEFDFSAEQEATELKLEPEQCRLFMLADKRWKFMHAEGGFRPMLFDMQNDPHELEDLGAHADYQEIIELMYERLGRWARRMSQRTTLSDAAIKAKRGRDAEQGVFIGLYDGSEIPEKYLATIQGKTTQKPN